LSGDFGTSIAPSARSLYGKLLAVLPDLQSLTGKTEAKPWGGGLISVEVLGRRDFFRRISVTQWQEDEVDGLVPVPCVEFVLLIDLQCAQVVSYENHAVTHSLYLVSSEDPKERTERLVAALVNSFLAELINLHLVFEPQR